MLGRSAIPVLHMPTESGIYRIVNSATDECYVGSSGNMRARCYQHSMLLANGDHYSKPMQQSFKLHGADAFRAEVVDTCDLSELSARETAWIERLCPVFNVHQRAGMIRAARQRKVKNRSVVRRDAQALMYRRAARAKRWNDVAAALRTGTSTDEIIATHGVSPVYVSQVRKEAGLPPRKRGRKPGHTPAFIAKLAELEALDWSQRDADIARQLNLSRERIRQIRLMMGKQHLTLSASA